MPEIEVKIGAGQDYNLPQKAEVMLQWKNEKDKWEEDIKTLDAKYKSAASEEEKLGIWSKIKYAKSKLLVAQKNYIYWRNLTLDEARPGGLLVLGLFLGGVFGYVVGQWSLLKKNLKKKKKK